MTQISSNGTIAKNTVLLYVRMLFTLLVSLYTSRVILRVLGVDDNGIYNIVSGAVGFFSFLNGTLSGATSRFLTFEQVHGDNNRLRQTFSAALIAHIVIALLVLILLETVGIWIVNNKLTIPAERMGAARVTFHLSALASMVSITQVPYNASIIAHERMGAFAYMSILEVVLKLLICFAITVSPFDKLVSYAFLVLMVSVVIQLIYRFYCIRNFDECHLFRIEDRKIFRPILEFSLWDMVGCFSSVARDQGVDMILNNRFGPAVNSAGGYAGTIGNMVSNFSANFLTAIKPPIIKSYSVGDIRRMESLMIDASKYSFALMALLSTPFFFESQYVVTLWLETPPEHTASFCAIDLGLGVLSSMFLPLVYAIHATGKIRFMSIVNGLIWIAVVPITYVMLCMGYPPEVPYVVKYFLLVFVVISNCYSVKRYIPSFHIAKYLKKGVLPSVLTMLVVLSVTYLVYIQFGYSSFVRFVVVCVTSTVSVCLCVYSLVFDAHIREVVNAKVLNVVRRIVGRG